PQTPSLCWPWLHPTPEVPKAPKPHCDGSIRLVSGPDTCQGRVEIFYRGNWGTVCDDDWGLSDASVVCRQLGCGTALAATVLGSFGYGSGPVLLDNVGCGGGEARLADCFHLGWGQHNCGHHEDAGVICRGESGSWQEGVSRLPMKPSSVGKSRREWVPQTTGFLLHMGTAVAVGAVECGHPLWSPFVHSGCTSHPTPLQPSPAIPHHIPKPIPRHPTPHP
uniref:Uncharacterized protein n=1 Tax=Corvus moneduloides TaxID=1196302 RepID=A0A8U7N6E2_CORMO